MRTHDDALQVIVSFARFTERIWTPHAADRLDETDLAIMRLGLAGECGEVLDEVVGGEVTGTVDRHALVLELGDVLHYWGRIALAFGLNVGELAREGSGGDAQLAAEVEMRGGRQLAALRLGGSIGRCIELLKKRVRDHRLDPVAFAESMRQAFMCWTDLRVHYGLSVVEIVQANRQKMASKYGLDEAVAFG